LVIAQTDDKKLSHGVASPRRQYPRVTIRCLIRINESRCRRHIILTSANIERVFVMAEAATKLPVKTETAPTPQPAKAADWQPFEVLRNQVDRLFHDFQTGFLQNPFFRPLPDIESFWRRDLP
jgi:hypothetical protein